MSTFHKCGVPVVGTKAGGLSQVKPCGKLATVKSRDGRYYVCAEHALGDQKGRQSHG